MEHGIGMQQQSTPSQEKHLFWPGVTPPGFVIDETELAAEDVAEGLLFSVVNALDVSTVCIFVFFSFFALKVPSFKS
ncbi:hypothetical protein L228DRAFT_248749 [Xylona heveae TC161]|uniref:Uncharacterized protein n=1 Tax=Xylona heveae (strain CBS 132557 / TC161) TaxID=1328760 RepID=A0A165FI32_XYLHT|nr:hypothetical protein L228DRAFT_248749 [Xylona heveae TC161]KZF21003.1 hypothetical protein L228DRAFT_248749 [Xylona heveae TC161]